MSSWIEAKEYSQQDGLPFECYKFTHNKIEYLYTSKKEDVSLPITENGLTRTERYYADYIQRSALSPGSEGAEAELTITVSKDCAVAMLYQGAPPEEQVEVRILRFHAPDYERYDVLFYGRITQASFENSQCSLTVKLENWLDKELPNGMYQYFCNNTLFDGECRLKREDYKIQAMVNKTEGLTVFSTAFANYPDGYFSGGVLWFDGRARVVDEHTGDRCILRYPFTKPAYGQIEAAPGCDKKFSTCAAKFANTLNFSGFMYMPPTDSEKNPAGTGAYWQDSEVIQRDSNGFVGTISL